MVRHTRLCVVLLLIGWAFVAVEFRASRALNGVQAAAAEAMNEVLPAPQE
jgi:hypothetical protein